MVLKKVLCLVVLLLVAVPTGSFPSKQRCVCTEEHQQFCGNGECYFAEDCLSFGCSCFKGWVGDTCHTECKRDCNSGICYINDGQEECMCPFGYIGASNCTKRSTNDIPAQSIHQATKNKKFIIMLVAIPLSILASVLLILYHLWKRHVWFAMRIVHYFHWQNRDDNKEFDAFISFRSCTNDELWVLNTLFPKLEKEMGFRLCIHLRDFPAGEFISNNIIDAIEKSKRTILVISPDYVTSEWTRMEYQVAQQEMLKLRHRIIPIIFRDIDDTNSIDNSLKFLLETVTYIKWPGEADTKQQGRFWEQLKLTMPKMAVQTETPNDDNG